MCSPHVFHYSVLLYDVSLRSKNPLCILGIVSGASAENGKLLSQATS